MLKSLEYILNIFGEIHAYVNAKRRTTEFFQVGDANPIMIGKPVIQVGDANPTMIGKQAFLVGDAKRSMSTLVVFQIEKRTRKLYYYYHCDDSNSMQMRQEVKHC